MIDRHVKPLLRSAMAVLKHRALKLAGLDIAAEYVEAPPSPQHAIDIFADEWASRFPEPYGDLEAGDARLFEDERIRWLRGTMGGFTELAVCECGPLEGAHTYMLERGGAASIVAVEANTRAYLRCLVTKEILELRRSRFLLGDFVAYLEEGAAFDLIVACGVLYHLADPVRALAIAARATDNLYIWTHYYDHAAVHSHRTLAARFQGSTRREHLGFPHTLHRQLYQTKRGNAGFFGGAKEHSCWLERSDLLGALRFFGYDDLTIHFDRPDDPAGPNISLLARRSPSSEQS